MSTTPSDNLGDDLGDDLGEPLGHDPGDDRVPRLVFLHVPKTGGTTMMRVLEAAYPGRTHYIQNGAWTEQRERLAALGVRLHRALVFMGHTPYGIHEVIPYPCRSIVVLRHPGDRIVSLYHHILREPKHHLHERVAGRGMSLEDFGTSAITAAVDNYQTRMLAGGEPGFSHPPGRCPEALLEIATANLCRPENLVGTQDRLAKFIRALRRELGWSSAPRYESLRVTPDRSPFKKLDPGVRAALEQANALDMRLYEKARSVALGARVRVF